MVETIVRLFCFGGEQAQAFVNLNHALRVARHGGTDFFLLDNPSAPERNQLTGGDDRDGKNSASGVGTVAGFTFRVEIGKRLFSHKRIIQRKRAARETSPLV